MMSARNSLNRLRTASARVLGAFSKRRRDRDLDEELGSHLDALIEEKSRQGMAPELGVGDRLLDASVNRGSER